MLRPTVGIECQYSERCKQQEERRHHLTDWVEYNGIMMVFYALMVENDEMMKPLRHVRMFKCDMFNTQYCTVRAYHYSNTVQITVIPQITVTVSSQATHWRMVRFQPFISLKSKQYPILQFRNHSRCWLYWCIAIILLLVVVSYEKSVMYDKQTVKQTRKPNIQNGCKMTNNAKIVHCPRVKVKMRKPFKMVNHCVRDGIQAFMLSNQYIGIHMWIVNMNLKNNGVGRIVFLWIIESASSYTTTAAVWVIFVRPSPTYQKGHLTVRESIAENAQCSGRKEASQECLGSNQPASERQGGGSGQYEQCYHTPIESIAILYRHYGQELSINSYSTSYTTSSVSN